MTQLPPLIELPIEPESKADWQEFAAALAKLQVDDRCLVIVVDAEAGVATLKGASESHLDSVVSRLKRDSAFKLNIGAPQVAYRERLSKPVEIDYTRKTQIGGVGEFARVKIAFELNEAEEAGNLFESRIVGDGLPGEFVAAVEEGIRSALGAGVLAGFPVIDLKATLIDAAFHDSDSSAPAFEIASRAATREALKKGGSVLFEPIMMVEVVTPEDYAGSVVGDLTSRRSEIRGQEMRGEAVIVTALTPMSNMFGYINQLRSFTQGRASHTMTYSHYAPLPSPNDEGPFRPAMALRA